MFRKIKENWLIIWYIVVIAFVTFSIVADAVVPTSHFEYDCECSCQSER